MRHGKKRNLRIDRIAGCLLLLLGILIFGIPSLWNLHLEQHSRQEIQRFREMMLPEESEAEAELGGDESVGAELQEPGMDPEEIDRLRDACLRYNRQLFRTGQKAFTAEGLNGETVFQGMDRLFGTIEIPTMEVTLPLYLGASNRNMAEGAAILGGTSLPLGGKDTNCVIAGHRGYRGAPYFREIERLQAADPIYITNRWERLCYRVDEICIISPTDSEKVRIRPGEDRITLITCHPYRSHGRFRYVVSCVRDAEAEGAAESAGVSVEKKEKKQCVQTPLQEDALSERDISRERILRQGSAVLLGLMILRILAGVLWDKDTWEDKNEE